MKVKCVNDSKGTYAITIDMIYEVLSETAKYYSIIDDCGIEAAYFKHRFKPVDNFKKLRKLMQDV